MVAEDIRDQRIAELSEQVNSLQKQLDILMRQRPKLSSKNLMYPFKSSLTKMQEELKVEEGPVNYIVDKFDIDLKVNVTLDERGEICYQFPLLEDIIPPDNLSTLHLSVKPVPKFPAPPPNTAEVPNVVGMSKARALVALKKAGFKAGAITEEPSTVAPGTVIEQNPKPYSRVKIGSSIDLVISKILEVEVPRLIGMHRDDALETIRISRLTVGEITEEISDSPSGTVISQSITAGTVVEIETAIDLIVAIGLIVATPELVRVPDEQGKKLGDAEKIIKDAKLRVGKVTGIPSGEPVGTVLEQSPEAGEEIPVNTPVDLVISELRTVEVPDVRGKKLEDARKIIESAHLRVGTVEKKASEQPAGTVIEQVPEAGKEVPMNAPVNLVIAKPRLIEVPNVQGKNLEEARAAIEEAHLKVGNIEEKTSEQPAGTVIEQTPKAGEEATVNTAINLRISKPKMVKVPKAVGKSLKDAEKAIEKANLVLGKVTEKESEKPPNTVIEQAPGARKQAPIHSEVDVTISVPRTVTVPNVVGMKKEEAVNAIKEQGLALGETIEKKSRKPKDTVIAQEPSPGSEVPAGTTVKLTISIGWPPTP